MSAELQNRITMLEKALTQQRENYIKLYEATMGEGTSTCDLKDIVEIAKRQQKLSAIAYKLANHLDNMLDYATYGAAKKLDTFVAASDSLKEWNKAQ